MNYMYLIYFKVMRAEIIFFYVIAWNMSLLDGIIFRDQLTVISKER